MTPKEAHDILKKKDNLITNKIFDYGDFFVAGSGEDTCYKVYKDTGKVEDFPMDEYFTIPVEKLDRVEEYEIAI